MPTGKEIVAAARTYLGVPYHHQGRNRKYGLDCVGILVVVAEDLGMFYVANTKYGFRTRENTLHDALRENGCVEIPLEEARTGDIFTFWYERREIPYHAAIIEFEENGSITLIHSSGGSPRRVPRRGVAHLGKVTEHRMDEFWEKRLVSAFRHREVTE